VDVTDALVKSMRRGDDDLEDGVIPHLPAISRLRLRETQKAGINKEIGDSIGEPRHIFAVRLAAHLVASVANSGL